MKTIAKEHSKRIGNNLNGEYTSMNSAIVAYTIYVIN